MTPIRIFIVALLVYIAFRLVIGGQNTKKPSVSRKEKPRDIPANDTLEKDPVCGILVPRHQAVILTQRGETFYFCSEECCKTFISQRGEQK